MYNPIMIIARLWSHIVGNPPLMAVFF